MRGISDASGRCLSSRDGAVFAEQLSDEPINEDKGRRNIGYEHENQSVDSGPGKLEKVRSHHACDRAACADGRERRVGVEEHMSNSGRHAAYEIEGQKFRVTQRILEALAECPQEQHVADNVTPSSVQEH